MNNYTVTFEIPPDLIEPYMRRVAFMTKELAETLKEFKQKGVIVPPDEEKIIVFDIRTGYYIYHQLKEHLEHYHKHEAVVPESVKQEVDDILKRVMK